MSKLLRSAGRPCLSLCMFSCYLELFRSLEERVSQQAASGEDVVIRGYGISMTTLEEVFMRIG